MPRAKERHLANELLAAAMATPAWKESASNSPSASPSGYNGLDPGAVALQDLWWALLNSNEFILVR